MGTNDLAKELGARFRADRLPLMAGLGACVLAARAEGRVIVDGVFNAFKDDAGLQAECEQGRDMGFDGKTLIHPAQLDIANAVFAPSRGRDRACPSPDRGLCRGSNAGGRRRGGGWQDRREPAYRDGRSAAGQGRGDCGRDCCGGGLGAGWPRNRWRSGMTLIVWACSCGLRRICSSGWPRPARAQWASRARVWWRRWSSGGLVLMVIGYRRRWRRSTFGIRPAFWAM